MTETVTPNPANPHENRIITDPAEAAAFLRLQGMKIQGDLMNLWNIAQEVARTVGDENLPIEFTVTLRNLFYVIQGRQGGMLEVQTPDLLGIAAFTNLVAQLYVMSQQGRSMEAVIGAVRAANPVASNEQLQPQVELPKNAAVANAEAIDLGRNVIRGIFGKKKSIVSGDDTQPPSVA